MGVFSVLERPIVYTPSFLIQVTLLQQNILHVLSHECLMINTSYYLISALYLELCWKIFKVTNVTVSASTVCRVLHEMDLLEKGCAGSQTTIYRGDFMAQALQYSHEFFVWTDCSVCTDSVYC